MRPWSWLAVAAIACAPQAPSPHAPRAATVVNVPAPVPDASAPRSAQDASLPSAPESQVDASEPSVDVDAGLGTGPGAARDGGVSLSFRGTLKFSTGDGGFSFDGSVSSGSLSFALSPDLVVRSALLVRTSSSGRELLLFDRKADCGNRAGLHTDVPIDWKRGTKTTFVTMSLNNGQVEHYKGHVEVLDAPTAPGSTGAIRLDPPPDGNVRGGRVSVHVCS